MTEKVGQPAARISVIEVGKEVLFRFGPVRIVHTGGECAFRIGADDNGVADARTASPSSSG